MPCRPEESYLNPKFSILMVVPLLFLFAAWAQSTVIYVNDDAGGNDDGSSWEDAFRDLQDGLTAATSGDEVWVAEGLYVPGADESDTFQLLDGVEIFGGFEGSPGSETDFNVRDVDAYLTILSGDFGGNDITDAGGVVTDTGNIVGANSKHVITGSGTDGTAALDGFTITAGSANGGGFLNASGGGMLIESGSPTLQNLVFSGNSASSSGGGIANIFGSPKLANTSFLDNSAQEGGAMFNDGGSMSNSNPTFTDVTFVRNSASSRGGGMYNDQCSLTLTNATFSHNAINGMYNLDSTLELTNVTFSGNSDSGMHNRNSNAELTNVTFSGNRGTDGAGMINIRSAPMLIDVTFSENIAAGNGGGMANFADSSPTLINVTFSENIALVNGGGMYSSFSDSSLLNVSLNGNAAGNGGGLYNIDGSDQAMTNGVFTGNTAASDGGGIYNNTSDATMTNVLFIGNMASSDGGGIYNDASDSALINVTFASNRAETFGGGMFNHLDSKPLIRNCIFWGNRDAGGTGADGQIYNADSGDAATISDCLLQGGCPTFALCSGTILSSDPMFVREPDDGGDGFGVGDNDDFGNLRLSSGSPAVEVGNNSHLPPDSLDSDGDNDTTEPVPVDLDRRPRIVNGTVDLGAYEFDLSAPTFTPTPTSMITQTPTRTVPPPVLATPTPTFSSLIYVNDTATGNDDGSSWTNAFTDLQDAIAASTPGDQIWVAHGIYIPGTEEDDTFNLKNGVGLFGGFEGAPGTEGLFSFRDVETFAAVLSGDIRRDDKIDPVGVLRDASDIVGFNNNHVVSARNTGKSAVLDGFAITGGQANREFPDNTFGGGIFNDQGSATFSNLTLSGNTAHSRGGGIYCNLSSSTLVNIRFTGNTATDGASLYIERSSSLSLTDSTFIANNGGRGAGIYNVLGSPALTNIIFDSNNPVSAGALYNEEGAPVLTNTTFTNNRALELGGGLYTLEGGPVLIDVIFSNNLARHGGGIYSYSRQFDSVGLVMQGGSLMANSATENGGGLYNRGPAKLNDVHFTGNSADFGSGGGLYSIFGDPVLTNVAINANLAGLHGGGMYFDGSNPSLTNITVAGNSAVIGFGGGIGGMWSRPTIRNSILWNNTAGGGGDQVFNSNLTACIVEGGCPDLQSACIDVIDADPLFVDADGADGIPGTPDDDLSLSVGSPAIDRGDNDLVPAETTTDLAGNPRITDGEGDMIANVDLGAFEKAERITGVEDCDLNGDQKVDAEDVLLLMESASPYQTDFLFHALCWQEEIIP